MIKQALTSVDDPIRRLHRTAYAPSRRMQMMRARSRLRSFFWVKRLGAHPACECNAHWNTFHAVLLLPAGTTTASQVVHTAMSSSGCSERASAN